MASLGSCLGKIGAELVEEDRAEILGRYNDLVSVGVAEEQAAKEAIAAVREQVEATRASVLAQIEAARAVAQQESPASAEEASAQPFDFEWSLRDATVPADNLDFMGSPPFDYRPGADADGRGLSADAMFSIRSLSDAAGLDWEESWFERLEEVGRGVDGDAEWKSAKDAGAGQMLRRNFRTPQGYVQQESDRLIDAVRSFESRLVSMDMAAAEIADAIQAHFGFPVDKGDYANGLVWWRPAALRSEARPSDGATTPRTVGLNVTPAVKSRIIEMARAGMSVADITKRLSEETKRYVSFGAVARVVEADGLSRAVTLSARQRLYTSPSVARMTAPEAAAYLSRVTGQEVTARGVQRGRQRASRLGVSVPGGVRRAVAGRGVASVWTDMVRQTLSSDRLMAMDAASASEALRAEHGISVTPKGVREARARFGLSRREFVGASPNGAERHPPRLYLRQRGNMRRWVIRDGARETWLGLGEEQRDLAEKRLIEYIAERDSLSAMFSIAGTSVGDRFRQWRERRRNAADTRSESDAAGDDRGAAAAEGGAAADGGGRPSGRRSEADVVGDGGLVSDGSGSETRSRAEPSRQRFEFRDGQFGIAVDGTPTAAGERQRDYFIYKNNAAVPSDRASDRTARNIMRHTNNWLAHVNMIERVPGRWEVTSLKVRKNWRGQRIASDLYDFIERDLGITMEPSGLLKPDGYAFWLKRRPEAVQYHQRVNDLYLSPTQLVAVRTMVSLEAERSDEPKEVERLLRDFNTLNGLINSMPEVAFEPDASGNVMFSIADSSERNSTQLADYGTWARFRNVRNVLARNAGKRLNESFLEVETFERELAGLVSDSRIATEDVRQVAEALRGGAVAGRTRSALVRAIRQDMEARRREIVLAGMSGLDPHFVGSNLAPKDALINDMGRLVDRLPESVGVHIAPVLRVVFGGGGADASMGAPRPMWYDPHVGRWVQRAGTTPEAEAKWSAILDEIPVSDAERKRIERAMQVRKTKGDGGIRAALGASGANLQGGVFDRENALSYLGIDLGRYKRLLAISLAYGPEIALQTFTHEEIHALRAVGLIGTPEWNVLSGIARKKPRRDEALRLIEKMQSDGKLGAKEASRMRQRAGQITMREIYRIDARYRKVLSTMVPPAVTEQGRTAVAAWIEDKLVEEVVAHAAADWADGRSYGTRIDRVMMRIRDFMEALGNFMRGNGYLSVNDVFDSVWSGEVAKREGSAERAVQEWMRANDVTAMAVRPGEIMAALRGPQLFDTIAAEIRSTIDAYRSGRDTGGQPGAGTGSAGTGPGQSRFGRALDGSSDPGQGSGRPAAGASPTPDAGTSRAGDARLPITDRLRSLGYDYLADKLSPAAVATRRKAQGFTIDAWHGTAKVFDTPDAFRKGRDFGFHVAIGKPDAANERLGYPATLQSKIEAFLDKLFKRPSYFDNLVSKSLTTSILPLAVKADNSLRLPDMIRWDDPLQYKDMKLASQLPGWMQTWVRDWFFANNAYREVDAQSFAQMQVFGRDLAAELERRGYDSIIYKNEAEAKGTDSLLVWNPAQVRSAFDAFDDRAAGESGLRASDKYVEADLREAFNAIARENRIGGDVMFALSDNLSHWPKPIDVSDMEDVINAKEEDFPIAFRGALVRRVVYSNAQKDEVRKLGEGLPQTSVKSIAISRIVDGPIVTKLQNVDGNSLYRVNIKYGNDVEYILQTPAGERIASAIMGEGNNVGYVSTSPQYARKGYATKLYDAIEKDRGKKLWPSYDLISKEANEFWLKRAPDLYLKVQGWKGNELANRAVQALRDRGMADDQIKDVSGKRSIMFAFAGERARTADLDALAKAKQMEADGSDRTKIWTETGWFKGKDGRWRFEIDDSGVMARGLTEPPQNGLLYPSQGAAVHIMRGRLGNIVDLQGIEDAYPQVARERAKIGVGDVSNSPSNYYSLFPFFRGVSAGGGSLRDLRRGILHETQHGIQSVENFGLGGSAGSEYVNLAGEVEARAVEKRMDMTPEERRARPPWLDYDVPEDQQIVRFADGSGPMFALADRETGQSMRRDLDALGYYSQALEAAKGLKQAKGTPEQMLAQLKSAGVKDAEIEATGLKGFLHGKKAITRDEIIAHLEANRVGLNESTYQRFPQQADIAQELFGRPFVRLSPTEQSQVSRQMIERGRDVQVAKWQNHSLDPSNPSYRETVLHLPVGRTDSFDEFFAAYRQRFPEAPEAYAREAYEQGAVRPPDVGRSTSPAMPDVFRTGHFPEPNIIGHMMTSMVKHEGKPTYLVDQIQSDWGQKLRDGGVRDEAKIAEINRQISEITASVDREWLREAGGNWLRARDNARDQIGRDASQEMGFEDNAAGLAHDRLMAELRTAEAATPGNPLVNTTDQWVNTTLRRAIRQAAEADASYIAIPHGDTVLSYNPGDENGMRGFYGSRTSEGIVPKNLRKLLEKIDKEAARPVKVEQLETTKGLEGYQDEIASGRPQPDSNFDPDQTGFTLFPLTDKVKRSVINEGQAMFSIRDPGVGRGSEDPSLDRAITDLKEALGIAEAGGSSRSMLMRALQRFWRGTPASTTTQGLYGLTVRQGGQSVRFRPARNVRGQYDRRTGITAVRLSRDIATIAHEGGHAMERLLGTPLDELKVEHWRELLPATDVEPPAFAPTGYSGIDLDVYQQGLVTNAVQATLELRDAMVPGRPSVGRVLTQGAIGGLIGGTIGAATGTAAGNAVGSPVTGSAVGMVGALIGMAIGSAGRIAQVNRPDRTAQVEVATRAGEVYADLVREVGQRMADKITDDVLAAAPDSVEAYVGARFSASGTPRRRTMPVPDGPALSEAFARWFERYIMDNEGAQREAPSFYAALNDLLDAEMPGVASVLHKAHIGYREHINRTPAAQLAADLVSRAQDNAWERLAADGSFENITGKLATAYNGIFDDLNPMNRAVTHLLLLADRNGVRDDQGRPISLKVGENPYKLLRLFRDSYSRGRMWLENGIADLGSVETSGPSLRAALETAFGGRGRDEWSKDAYADFGSYLVAQRAIAEYDLLDAKKRTLAAYDDVLRQAAERSAALTSDLASGRAVLERRETALIRAETRLTDAKRERRSAETEVRNLEERLREKADDVQAAQMARDERLEQRRRNDMRMLERDARQAVERYEDASGAIEEFEIETAILRSEIDQRQANVDALEKERADLDDATSTLRAERKRAADRGASRPPTLQPREFHGKVLEELNAKYAGGESRGDFQTAARMVREWTHRLLTVRFQAGFITEEMYRELSDRKAWYVPFQRDMSDAGAAEAFGGAGPKKWSPFKKFDGSDRAIINPLETLSQDAYVTAQQIAFNDAIGAFIGLAERTGPGGGVIAERVPRSETLPANESTFDRIRETAVGLGVDPVDAHMIVQRMEQSFSDADISLVWAPDGKSPIAPPQLPLWVNGERQLVRLNDRQFGEELFNAINGLGQEMSSLILEWAAKPARWLRTGVTTHPNFIARNLLRDIPAAYIRAGVTPFAGHAEGLRILRNNDAEVSGTGLQRDDFLRLYNEAGGIVGGQNVASIAQADRRADVLDLRGSGPLATGTTGLMGHITSKVEAFETAGRLGIAAHAYRRAIAHNPALTQIEAMQEAAFVTRDVYDWARHGSKMLALNRIVTFLNAALQGTESALRGLAGQSDRGGSLRRNPKEAASLGGVMATAGAAGALLAGPAGLALGAAVGAKVAEHVSIVLRRESDGHLSAEEERALADAYRTFFRLSIITLFFLMLVAMMEDDPWYEDIKDGTKSTHGWVKLSTLGSVIMHRIDQGADMLGIRREKDAAAEQVAKALGALGDFGREWLPEGMRRYMEIPDEWRIPKPFEWAVPANVAEAVWDGIKGRDPRVAERIREQAFEVLAPPGYPQIATMGVGLVSGHDVRRGRDIVPDHLKKQLPHHQFDAFSSQLAIDTSKAIYALGGQFGWKPERAPSPKMIDWVLSNQGAYWGKDIANAYGNVKQAAGFSNREASTIYDAWVVAGVTGRGYRNSKSIEEFWKLHGQEGGKFTQAFTTYEQLLEKSGKPEEAAALLLRLEPEERAYALLRQHFTRSRRDHPIERAAAAFQINRDLRKDIILGELVAERSRRTGKDFETRITLSPAKQTEVHDILERLSQIEVRNSMILLDRPGWKGRPYLDPAPVIDELRASSPEVFAVFEERRQNARLREWDDVRQSWPRNRAALLKDGENAALE